MLANRVNYGRVRVYLNRKKGMSWEGINVVDPEVRVGGDWLSVGHFNSDRYLATSSGKGVILVWDVQTGKRIGPAFEHNADLICA